MGSWVDFLVVGGGGGGGVGPKEKNLQITDVQRLASLNLCIVT